jgi:peptidoglycan-associated lipoprotein
MNKKIMALIGALALLSACETASQKVVTTGSTASSSGSTSSSTSSSVDKKKSLFAQAKQTASDKLIAVGDRVLFDYDSAKLDSSAKILLDAQSRFLRANTDLNFIIEGHCDERGTREYNLALGEQRATAVRDYLVIQGIDPDRIKEISYGKDNPDVEVTNTKARSKNSLAFTIFDLVKLFSFITF